MRMIERWFPCAEVSEASYKGWGSGNSEATLFPWFAKRPLAQARAAVLTSVLPWPEEPEEQLRLQNLVRRAMQDYNAAHDEVVAELAKAGAAPTTMDLFSGRAMIPLEAARYGMTAHGIDYSPVAALAGQLLADYPMRDWSAEPPLPFGNSQNPGPRLLNDVEVMFEELGERFTFEMARFYPSVEGQPTWGYLWAVTLPCQECDRRFPLTGSLVLRPANPRRHDPGQSYRIDVDRSAGTWSIAVHNGPPTGTPTRVLAGKSKFSSSGKVAICPFCEHVHPKDVHTRLARAKQGEDAVLLAAEIDNFVGKRYRSLTPAEREAVVAATEALAAEPPFKNRLPAVPDEVVPPGNTWTVQATVYGVSSYGDMCTARQTLGFVKLARIITTISEELAAAGVSSDYVRALSGYATAVLVRKLRRATRGCTLAVNRQGVSDIFQTESSLGFSYDFFEAGLGDGPGTWDSLADGTLAALRKQLGRKPGKPANIERGSALALRHKDGTMTAVITDPPYDAMIDYSDASDLFYVWLKRAMSVAAPDLSFTANEHGVQEKDSEIIVKKGGTSTNDFRTRERYDRLIGEAFAEARRVVQDDGVVTIVFGHGDPDVWHRLLGAITRAGLVLTGSWPAKTESGGSVGSANIVTTLTMSCRPAPPQRPQGRANLVEAEVRREVQARIPFWDAAGLAPTDQLMASAGPAMEAVGRYAGVLDHLGDPVDPAHYLVVARKAVIDATSVPVENLPLDTFDGRTRFALGWTRLYRRAVAPKSEARWQAMAADLTLTDLKGVLYEADKGVRLVAAKDWKGNVTATSSVIDVAMSMAKAWPGGLDEVAQVLAAAERDENDAYLWATLNYLSSLLPEADPDAVAWTSLVRARRGIGNVARGVVSAQHEADQQKDRQRSLFDTDMAGEPS